MSSECHVRISFDLMAMFLLSTDCSFNETGVGEGWDQMKKIKGGDVEIKDMN